MTSNPMKQKDIFHLDAQDFLGDIQDHCSYASIFFTFCRQGWNADLTGEYKDTAWEVSRYITLMITQHPP